VIEWIKDLLGIGELWKAIADLYRKVEGIITLFEDGDVVVTVGGQERKAKVQGYIRGAHCLIWIDSVEWGETRGLILIVPGAGVQALVRYGGLADLVRGVMTLENNDGVDHVIGSCRWTQMPDRRLAIVPMPARTGGEFHLREASLNPDWPWNLGAGFSLRLSIVIP